MADKLREVLNHQDANHRVYLFWCPGCGRSHPYDVPRWNFNGSMDKPSFTPSLLVNPHEQANRCHLYVTDGKIQYLSDCFHGLAGQTVEMSDWNEEMW